MSERVGHNHPRGMTADPGFCRACDDAHDYEPDAYDEALWMAFCRAGGADYSRVIQTSVCGGFDMGDCG